MAPFYDLDPKHTDPARMKREREKAKKLRSSNWWKQLVAKGECHYCSEKFSPKELTMDHIVPLARGGTSTQGNLVPSCRPCNERKQLETPAEKLLREMASK